jgi:hypothetical protein
MCSSNPPCVQIQKGVSGARSDDTKSLKSVIIDWITPADQPLSPPLPRNVKTARGFNHDRTGFLLCPVGLDWTNAEYGHCTFRTPLGTDAFQNTGESQGWSTARDWRTMAHISL